MRRIQQSLTRAADRKIVEVLSLVDSLPDRGAADALLEPLRARLSQLRLPRRMNFTRLLFLPADPIIVPAAQWRRKALTVPRTVLRSLSLQVRQELGSETQSFDDEIESAASDAAFMRCGAGLWPRAADILARTRVPADWLKSTCLNTTDHAAIAQPLAVMLRQGNVIEDLARAGHAVSPAALRACITNAADSIPSGTSAVQGLGMLLAVLLERLPSAALVITTAGDIATARGDTAPRLGADLAIDFLLDGKGAGHATQSDLTTASQDLSRLAGLLDALEQPGPASRPGRKSQVAKLRHDIDTACRRRFEVEMAGRLLRQADLLTANAADADIADLEATVLELRRFEAACRPFGIGSHYDRVLGNAAQQLMQNAPATAGRCDVARFLEILVGPEAGLAWLQSGAAGASL